MCEGVKIVSGVVDRFTDQKQAVILLEALNKELVVSQQELPEGTKAQDWLLLEQRDNHFQIISIDYEKTKQKKEKARSLRNALRKRSQGSIFKRSD